MAADDRQIRVELPRPYAGFQSPVPMIINARIARATGVIMTCEFVTVLMTRDLLTLLCKPSMAA